MQSLIFVFLKKVEIKFNELASILLSFVDD